MSAMLVDHASDNASQLGEPNNLDSIGTPPNPKKRDGRKPAIGKVLDNWTRVSRAEMTINVVEGKKRPEQLLQAAKLASECGIAVRNYVPIFPHWKEYKKEENKEVVTNYMDKVVVRFDMDVEDKVIKDACTDMLKNGVRQMRYSHFIASVGPQENCTRYNCWAHTRVEEELRLEKEGASRLQEKIEAQQHELDVLKRQVEEGDESRKKQGEEMDLLNRRQAETEALVQHLLRQTQI